MRNNPARFIRRAMTRKQRTMDRRAREAHRLNESLEVVAAIPGQRGFQEWPLRWRCANNHAWKQWGFKGECPECGEEGLGTYMGLGRNLRKAVSKEVRT